jgi:hypothetical protein
MSSYGIVTRKNEVPSAPMEEFIGILRAVANRLEPAGRS